MEQIPPQDKARVDGLLQHEALLPAPDAGHGLERVKTGHEISLNRHFHKPKQLWAVERETEGLLGEVVDGRWLPMATLMGLGEYG